MADSSAHLDENDVMKDEIPELCQESGQVKVRVEHLCSRLSEHIRDSKEHVKESKEKNRAVVKKIEDLDDIFMKLKDVEQILNKMGLRIEESNDHRKDMNYIRKMRKNSESRNRNLMRNAERAVLLAILAYSAQQIATSLM